MTTCIVRSGFTSNGGILSAGDVMSVPDLGPAIDATLRRGPVEFVSSRDIVSGTTIPSDGIEVLYLLEDADGTFSMSGTNEL